MSPCGVRLWSGMNRIDESVGWGADGLGQSPAGVKARCHEQLTDGRSAAITASVVHACHVQLTPRVIVCIQVSLVSCRGPPSTGSAGRAAARRRSAARPCQRAYLLEQRRSRRLLHRRDEADRPDTIGQPIAVETCSLANVCSRSGPNSTLCSVGIARPATLVGVRAAAETTGRRRMDRVAHTSSGATASAAT